MTKKIFLLMYGLFMFATYSVHAMDQSWLPCNQQPGACTAQSGLPRQSVVLPEPPLDMSPEAQIARAIIIINSIKKRVSDLEQQDMVLQQNIDLQAAAHKDRAAGLTAQHAQSVEEFMQRFKAVEGGIAASQKTAGQHEQQVAALKDYTVQQIATLKARVGKGDDVAAQNFATIRAEAENISALANESRTNYSALMARIAALENQNSSSQTALSQLQNRTGRLEDSVSGVEKTLYALANHSNSNATN